MKAPDANGGADKDAEIRWLRGLIETAARATISSRRRCHSKALLDLALAYEYGLKDRCARITSGNAPLLGSVSSEKQKRNPWEK